jgi:hypothetical protein
MTDAAIPTSYRPEQAVPERHRGELQRQAARGCLSLEWFRSRTEARVIIGAWRRYYNEIRPHSRLGYRTPAEFQRHHSTTQPGATSFEQYLVRNSKSTSARQTSNPKDEYWLVD